jgi:ATP-binding protein involved in chromosome partitioning
MKQAFASEFGEHINLKLKIASPEPTEVQQNQIKGKQIPEFKILSRLHLVKVGR